MLHGKAQKGRTAGAWLEKDLAGGMGSGPILVAMFVDQPTGEATAVRERPLCLN